MKNNFDLATAMVQNLQNESRENILHTNKLSIALLCLNKAANILDNMKDHASSEKITQVIEKLATLK
jgi:hypothetical protein